MTDTDKLKRLAEAALKHMTAETIPDYHASEAAWREFEAASTNPKAILALIAENERFKAERNEAVALLRLARGRIHKWEGTLHNDIGVFIRSLARIDAAE